MNLPEFIRIPLFRNYLKRKGALGFPPQVSIETTNICNLNCAMCPRQFMKRKLGVMDFKLFQKIISEISGKNIKELSFHLFGEPLVKPDILFKMLDYAERKMPKTKLTFSENGVLLNKENSIRILKSPLNRITLSLDGATKKTYEKLRRNGNFEIVMKNVENFMILKRKINPSLEAELQIIKTTENSNEISAFKRKWRPFLGKNDMITIKEFTTFGGKIKDISIKSLSRKARRFARNLMPCRALWLTLNIHWNGDVVACCLDCDGGLKLGNCKKQTLSEIINGEKMRKLREMSINMSLKKIPLCAGCYGS